MRKLLHNEARNLLVEAYEKTHDAKVVALACGVSVPTVYRLAEQKAKTGSVDLRVSTVWMEQWRLRLFRVEQQRTNSGAIYYLKKANVILRIALMKSAGFSVWQDCYMTLAIILIIGNMERPQVDPLLVQIMHSELDADGINYLMRTLHFLAPAFPCHATGRTGGVHSSSFHTFLASSVKVPRYAGFRIHR